jgi:hypothetical protein
MIKSVKGAYNSSTNYAVGDVVKENGNYYVMLKDAGAGVHPFNTEYWGLISDPNTIDALDIAEDVMGAVTDLHPSEKELVLASSTADSTKKFKITVVDNGTISATEIT